MKLHIDQQADALYLRLDDSAIVESAEVAPGVLLDYNEANEVVGIEMPLRSLRAGAHPGIASPARSPNLNLTTLEFVTA